MTTDPADEDTTRAWNVGASTLDPAVDDDEVRARAAAGDQLADLAVTLHEHAVASAAIRLTWTPGPTPRRHHDRPHFWDN